MFYPINDTLVNPREVERIEFRKERFTIYFGANAVTFPMQFVGQANEMAKRFIRAHDGTLFNPEKVQYVQTFPTSRLAYMEYSYQTVVDEPEIEKLEAFMKRRGK